MSDAGQPFEACRDFVALARHRARTTPDLPVYTFVGFGDEPSQEMTCAELDRRATALAARLLTRVRPGDRALLLFAPGLDYIVALFGCLYAGVIAVPAYPVEPAQAERTLPRLIAMAADCAPAVILGATSARDACARLDAPMQPLARLPWLAVDTRDHDEPADAPDLITTPDPARLAYLQYTSGSTGAPKGVMISHRNLMHNSALIARRFGHDATSRGAIWLPPYHDMGLIGGILQPLHAGFPVALMSHLDFLKHPLRWLRTVSAFRATTSGGPNFAYEMLATMRIADSDLDRLDLASWRLAFVGAEPVRARTLRAFATRFARCGFDAAAFYPCYGLAEHTLFMTGSPLPRDGARATIDAEDAGIACGSSAEDSVLLVVDPRTRQRRADGEVGELWARGPSVAQGYWGQPALTRETFEARVEGLEGVFMRTGDYGYLRDGELVVTGRLKDMLIIRGANHYPHDLEATIETLDPDVFRPGGCAVFSVDAAQQAAPRVTVVRELRARHLPAFRDDTAKARDGHFERLRRAITQRHGIVVHDIVFTPPSAVPKTTSGKVQRHACRDLLLRGALPIVAQWHADPA